MSFVDLNNLLIEDLKKIKQNKKNKLRKEFNDYNEQKEKLIIAEIDEIMKQRKNILKETKTKYIIKTCTQAQTKIKNIWWLFWRVY